MQIILGVTAEQGCETEVKDVTTDWVFGFFLCAGLIPQDGRDLGENFKRHMVQPVRAFAATFDSSRRPAAA